MTKFKVGDVVERTGGVSGVWRAFAARDTGPYIVTSTTPGGWIQLNGCESIHEGLGKHPFDDDNFTLVEQDDQLPPAPESVRYYHRGYYGIHADAYLDVHSGHFASGPRIRINDKNNRGITIDADTALQLAHDLTRMAMEIKRREKQNA